MDDTRNGRLLSVALVLLLAVTAPCVAQQDTFARIEPSTAGFSEEGLRQLSAYLEEAGSASMVLAYDGKIFFEWGDIHQKLTVHSIRKALLNSLYGIYIERGVIDTGATLAELGIDDIEPPLTEAEKSAKLIDVLKSRSGVYHPAAAVSPGMLRGKPERGAHLPGEVHYYNNWDFNAAGAIFEQLTEKSIYEAFFEEIAKPLGMTQFKGKYGRLDMSDESIEIPDTDGFYQFEPSKSRYPAYHFRMSAHDLALYGSLYLNRGRWNGKQLVPESWIEASTTSYSTTNPSYGIGYGILWYVLLETENRPGGSFYHTGTGIHMLGVYPTAKLVMVHRVNTEEAYDFPQERLYRIIGLVFGAKKSVRPAPPQKPQPRNP